MGDAPTEAVDVARLYIEHGAAVEERDRLRQAVGHVVTLVDLAKAVIAMRDAEIRKPTSSAITDYQAAKAVAYRLATQWEARDRER